MISLDDIDSHSEWCVAPKSLSVECFALGNATHKEANGKPYTVYNFMIVCQCMSIRWTFTKRFSDFVALHKHLNAMVLTHEEMQLMVLSQTELPPLPQKVLFGSMEPAVISSRQSALEAYAQALVQQYSLPQFKPLAQFLDLPNSLGGKKDHAGTPLPRFARSV
jgi:hypothetical protein